ncbi:MAG: glycine/betaine/sarcosine/D-proline family reductase selenoprotein B [Deltaproteobacteria bacterium]|nr:glycine/betaine/sarcosine/D-proline family reductase selenoprotein B [Deltaproteobacteria bacterium]
MKLTPQALLKRAMTLLFTLPSVQRRWARNYRAIQSEEIPWARLSKPLSRCRVALVTSGGVLLRSDPPFDMKDPDGDPSLRVIPSSAAPEDLHIIHDYYDHRDADRDVNVVLPMTALRALVTEGVIGEVGPRHYSLMGHIQGRHLNTLRERTAPEVAAMLVRDGVDLALFTPA